MRSDLQFGPGLTTTQAPLIEDARRDGRWYIEQPYELYSQENHATWATLFERMRPRWERFAPRQFLDGLDALNLDSAWVPRLAAINEVLGRKTGFVAKAVSGYVPAHAFFEGLRVREFPTTVTVRDPRVIDYLPEPDIFHDVAGHVPLHTDSAFASVLELFGECGWRAVERVRPLSDPERTERMTELLRAISRCFWFTVEFGLIRERDGSLKTLGSGLLSSYAEISHAIESPHVCRHPFQLHWVIHQSYAIDRFQPLLFVVDSVEQLCDAVRTLAGWITDGTLHEVAPGPPNVDEDELRGFLQRAG